MDAEKAVERRKQRPVRAEPVVDLRVLLEEFEDDRLVVHDECLRVG